MVTWLIVCLRRESEKCCVYLFSAFILVNKHSFVSKTRTLTVLGKRLPDKPAWGRAWFCLKDTASFTQPLVWQDLSFTFLTAGTDPCYKSSNAPLKTLKAIIRGRTELALVRPGWISSILWTQRGAWKVNNSQSYSYRTWFKTCKPHVNCKRESEKNELGKLSLFEVI